MELSLTDKMYVGRLSSSFLTILVPIEGTVLDYLRIARCEREEEWDRYSGACSQHNWGQWSANNWFPLTRISGLDPGHVTLMRYIDLVISHETYALWYRVFLFHRNPNLKAQTYSHPLRVARTYFFPKERRNDLNEVWHASFILSARSGLCKSVPNK